MKLLNTLLIKFTLVLLLGIIAGFYLDLSVTKAFILLGISLLIFSLSFLRARKLIFGDPVLGISTYLLFLIIGFTTTTIHLPQNQASHYIHFIASESSYEESQQLRLEVREILKPDLFREKYVAEVSQVNGIPAHGKILLLQPKDSTGKKIKVGDELLLSSNTTAIPSPLNPHQFNYARFMENRGILRQVNLEAGNHIMISGKRSGIPAMAELWRNRIVENLRTNRIGHEELAIVQALLLGQKQDISAETYNNYASAGAIHILAVSGLHVGILLLILNRVLSPLLRFKKGKILRTFLVILLLWGFAILAGLSPSVIRAVTMFSFLAIGIEMKRRSSSVNSLFLSLLFLILIRPQWIFEVGFQLSYAAVLAILLLQPLLYNLFPTKGKFQKYFWGLLTTTIAAQVGVLPLGLFYFHQFPGLFFLSNLVILPVLGFILSLGILVTILALLGQLPAFLGEAFGHTIALLNKFVAMVAGQERFLFEDVPFGISQVWSFYFLILTLIFFGYSPGFKKMIFVLAGVIGVQSVFLFKTVTASEESLLVFHKHRSTVLALLKNEKLLVYNNNDTNVASLRLVRNYKVGQAAEEISSKDLQNFYAVNDKLLFLLDSTGIYSGEMKRPDYLLLTGSPRINLERMIEELQPQIVLADGNNFRSFIYRWKRTCIKKGIPFHHTGEKGAFYIE
ncbi:ComEC/Rec2 family competence protein [Salinimicrobium flavum]|uniref:ComEC/Rec2 family competence protein n=1 Tax=Salinimicrobium flavum TaxID=1737065 RepID=A0ABW5IU75_9FLAO